MFTRREAMVRLLQFAAASPLLGAQGHDPLLDTVNVFDFEKLAQAKLDKIAWDYLSEGSDDEVSLRDNREAFNRILLRPRVLTDVSNVDLGTTILGHKLEYPIFLDPAGGKNCFWPNGELETARAAAAAHAMMICNGGIDALLASGKGPRTWFQYTTGPQFATRDEMKKFVAKLKDLGATGICFTVDNMYISHRERSIRNRFVRSWCETGIPRDSRGNLVPKPDEHAWTSGEFSPRTLPTPTWDTMRTLRDMTDLAILIKGIMTAEDTRLALAHGMSGVIVSNHGARALDHVGGTIEALPECVEAAAGKFPVLVDGGFRRGTDILKALALGATAVGVARPYLWGLASFGARGVSRVLDLLRTELALDMGMAGVARIRDIDRRLVRFR
jgi:isopentenyl diphosphate isomerase/L-lactate dehydrogenase-like FMN-dependent dehydrogenase